MDRRVLLLCITVGSTIGGYVPTFLGFSSFGVVSFVGGAVGAVAGIWAARRIDESL